MTPRLLLPMIAGCCLAWGIPFRANANPHPGAEIYQNLCAACHGAAGQGTEDYPRALTGPLAISQLAHYIDQAMPEGDPQACTQGDALAVAQHIHQAFYSPSAQQRLAPPQIELTHLTVRQFELSLLDLAQSLTWRGKRDARRGLTAEFYHHPWPNRDFRVHDEIVPQVDFQMIASGLFDPAKLFPTQEEIDKDIQAAARNRTVFMKWSGGIQADRTGEYQFIVRTNAGFKLWVNHWETPLIDRQVQSGEEQGGRASVRLLEGHQYPIRLEVSRVFENDVHVQLAWKPPGGAEQKIPARVLTPHPQPQQLVITTRLPPDDRSLGFERGSDVSARWDEANTYACLEATRTLVQQLPEALKLPEDPQRAHEAVRIACLKLGDQAFRRPLTDDEVQRLVNRYFQAEQDWKPAATYALLSLLKAPQFQYPEVGLANAASDWKSAGRLALSLWDSLPDEELRRAAQLGQLHDQEEIRRQAHWMAKDPRATTKLLAFLKDWLDIADQEELSRDPEFYPGFDEQVAADMRTSADLFLRRVVETDACDFRELFLADSIPINHRLANFLGAADIAGEQFQNVRLEPEVRRGVITHPYIVASHAYYRETSPIHRGVFLARRVFGRPLAPPPEAVAPTPPSSQPGLTTRERVALQTSPHACQHCHILINDLGFSLENFDAAGRYRDNEQGKPVVATGGYTSTDGQQVYFRNAKELAQFLAESEDVQRAVVSQLFEFVAKQPALAYGQPALEALLDDFRQNEFNLRHLLAEIAVVIATHPTP